MNRRALQSTAAAIGLPTVTAWAARAAAVASAAESRPRPSELVLAAATVAGRSGAAVALRFGDSEAGP